MNYLFFMPSLLTKTQELVYQPNCDDNCKEFYDILDKGFTGIQTNVAATKYIIAHLLKCGQKLDKILMLCSEEVLSTTIESEPIATSEEPISTYEYYKRTISEWAFKHGYLEEEIEGLFAPLHLENLNPGSWSQMDNTLKSFIQEVGVSSTSKDKLFIDYTGGNRSASMIMLAVARFLECKGIKVEKVLYSNITGSNNINKIEDCIETYKLLSAIGKDSDALLKIYKESGKTDQTVIDSVQATEDAYLMNRNGQNEAVFEDVKKTIKKKSDSFTEEKVVDNLNNVRKTLTLEGTILDSIEKKNAKRASELLREKIIEILEKKGIISWKKRDDGSLRIDKKNQPTVFYAFCKYYASFLKYVYTMLQKIYNEADLWSAFEEYLTTSMQLNQAKKPFTNVHWSIDKDFGMAYPDIVKSEGEKLSVKIHNVCDVQPLNVNDILDEIKHYQDKTSRYKYSYFFSEPWGFPFANYFNNRSYTVVYHNGRKQLMSALYIENLEKLIEWLSAKSDDKKSETIYKWLNDEDEFYKQFQPLYLKSLFYVDKTKISKLDWAKLIILLDANRDARNAFVHSSRNGKNVILSELERIKKIVEIVDIK